MKFRYIAVLTCLIATGSGCGLEEVKPWQRDLLAKESMQLVPDRTESYLDNHIYFSKEAAFGGQAVGGGGCGCN